jgi:hypothetical protein
MARRIRIEITVEEAETQESYSWRALARTDIRASIEMFAPVQTAIALVNGIRQVLAEADEKKAEDDVNAEDDDLASIDSPDEAVPA